MPPMSSTPGRRKRFRHHEESKCSCGRIVIISLFGLAFVWLALGVSMFRSATLQNNPRVQNVARNLRSAEKSLVANAEKLAKKALHRGGSDTNLREGASVVQARSAPVHASQAVPPPPPPPPFPPSPFGRGAQPQKLAAPSAAQPLAVLPPASGSAAASVAAIASSSSSSSSSSIAVAPAAVAATSASPPSPFSGNGHSNDLLPHAQVISSATGLGEGGANVGWDQELYDNVWSTSLGGNKLPPFWRPSPNVDLDTTGTYINGEPTIFLMVASYRDFQCRETITSALSRATHPDRVIVAAVEQNAPGDVGCLDPVVPCSEDPTQPLCARRHQIRIFKVDSKSASGPVFARHVGDRMYRGEYYAMQLDAHVTFILDWDELMISQYFETKNEYAVLSTYLTDVQGSLTPEGRSRRNTRPIMCNSHFEGSGATSHLRHLSQPEEKAVLQDTPMLQPFWAAGMSFSRGHFVTRVPYDCCLPMLFQGEEISIGIRAWTFGYDLYAPHASVIFHEYAVNSARRRGVHSFWENHGAGNPSASMKRMVSLIKMAPDLDPASYDHKDEKLYGLGDVRAVEDFYRLFGMNVRRKSMVPELCKFVKSAIMHRTFSPALRTSGKGIDYSGFKNFDVGSVIEGELGKLRKAAETHINNAMRNRRPGQIAAALDEAKRARLHNPSLLEKARALQAELKAGGKR